MKEGSFVMSELGELFAAHREAQKARRTERLPLRQREILALESRGYRVEQLTLYHFRINDCLDIYPIHFRYHDIKTGRRGTIRNLNHFVDTFFKTISRSKAKEVAKQ
jgi:hypothetical protein